VITFIYLQFLQVPKKNSYYSDFSFSSSSFAKIILTDPFLTFYFVDLNITMVKQSELKLSIFSAGIDGGAVHEGGHGVGLLASAEAAVVLGRRRRTHKMQTPNAPLGEVRVVGVDWDGHALRMLLIGGQHAALVGLAALWHGAVEAVALRSGGDVVVEELSPLHQQVRRFAVGVHDALVARVAQHCHADGARRRQLGAADGAPNLLDAVVVGGRQQTAVRRERRAAVREAGIVAAAVGRAVALWRARAREVCLAKRTLAQQRVVWTGGGTIARDPVN